MSDTQMATVPSFEEIRSILDALESWEDRFSYLIELGRKAPALEDHERIDANLVKGCQSRVWMILQTHADGRLRLRAQSDSQLVNGLIAILLALYNDASPSDLQAINAEEALDSLSLSEHLSSMRRNGLHAMIARIRRAGSSQERR